MEATLVNAVLIIVSILFGILTLIIKYLKFKQDQEQTEEKTSRSFDRLSTLLKDAGSEIEKMEQEVSAKSKRVQELEELSKRFDSLNSMKEEQVKAIREELSSALKESSNSNRIWTIVIGAIWFAIGLFVRGFLGF